jgi:hypothetical protein
MHRVFQTFTTNSDEIFQTRNRIVVHLFHALFK